jgi:uncharacterized protein YkwD
VGLVVCAVTLLLLGIVIGRMTTQKSDVDQVYLRNSQPTATATGTPTTTTGKAASGAARKDRPPLNHVSRPDTSGPTRTVGATGPSNKGEGTMIDGSYGDGGNWTTFGSEGGEVTDDRSAMEERVIQLTNIERRKAGCAPLRVDPRLMRSARVHSWEMARADHFHHSSPNGRSPWDRMEAAGYRDGGAENIARGYQTPEAAVRGWMRSKGHSRNILDCRMVATGVGVNLGPGGPWWTQDFGYS